MKWFEDSSEVDEYVVREQNKSANKKYVIHNLQPNAAMSYVNLRQAASKLFTKWRAELSGPHAVFIPPAGVQFKWPN